MELLTSTLKELTLYGGVGLFLMRLYVGWLFAYSGQRKIQKLKNFAEHNGLPVPVALLVVLIELIGGLAIILGVYTQIFSILIIGILFGAIYFHTVKWKSPFWAQSKGWEYDLMLILMLLVILTVGPGNWALLPYL